MGTLSNKKIVLVGGAGFIGHNLALELVRRGASVEVIDSLQVNNLLSLATDTTDAYNRELYTRIVNQRLELLREAGVVLHPQDARDYHALSRIIAQIKPNAIIQLAAVSHANRSNKDPFSTFDHSLRTLENALDIARDFCEHFVFLSSSMVYGNFQTESVTEDHPLNPMGIYGALKVAGEKIVIAYQQVFNLPYTIIRPSALYGARCVSRRVGQVFIENAIRGSKLRVDGDGSEKLDFTYIDDLVDGICLTLEQPAAKNEIFNLTYGAARPIKDLLEITQRYFPEVVVESIERDKLMPERGTLCVDKAKRLLGYAPKNPIDVGFPKYIEWYQSMNRLAGAKLPGAPLMQIKDDSWLAELMARPVFRLEQLDPEPDTAPLKEHQATHPGAFYYAKVDAKRVECVRRLCGAGFYVADTNVTLQQNRPGLKLSAPSTVRIGLLDPKDEPALLDVAEHTYELSRFHLDPLVPNAIADRIKREWAANYARKKRGDRLFVAYEGAKPVGFLAALVTPEQTTVPKTAVIDLVGVGAAQRGRGVGSALVSAFVDHYKSRGGALLVGTQVANIPSLRMYERLGFSFVGSQYVLHHHTSN